ncbi:chromosomal replication initiator protein DnaA [Sphingorhabdus sp. 109]|jgi:chromosomal replication initiator protein|uniref:chromosomal replication initiator protein DnaA n=1 Tax=Sphingorhabdus sp. 109 TaxID=2653173 RepID=UPI0012F3EF52|nr:Chromosomal replication initiator protein DnaA [Sphingorhabdus sp. 109]
MLVSKNIEGRDSGLSVDAAVADETVISGDLEASWRKICSGLRRDLGAQIFGQWIKPITLALFDSGNGSLHLELPSEFAATWVRDRYAERLLLAWKAHHPAVTDLVFQAQSGSAKIARVSPLNGTAAPASRKAVSESKFRLDLDPRMTFDQFIAGHSNILALNAAQRTAAAEKPLFSPLYLQSSTGQGKTHLMHAIGHAFREEFPSSTIIYMSAERFMIEFVSAMRRNEGMEFKASLREADLLMIDDIQFIVGKNSTQEEFLHTVDSLISQGKRVVVAADRPPQALDGVDQRLLSRLSMGLVADIQSAGLELRRDILEHRLASMPHQNVSEEVVDFLARTISRNLRELEGGLNKLLAYAQLTGREITRELAEEQLSDILSACRRRITIDEIQRTVCEYYRLDRNEMSSKRRARAVARPRQVAMYLAKVMTPRSYPEIGRKFGGRDHSTVIHAVKLVEQLRGEDSEMDNDVRMLLRQLES